MYCIGLHCIVDAQSGEEVMGEGIGESKQYHVSIAAVTRNTIRYGRLTCAQKLTTMASLI